MVFLLYMPACLFCKSFILVLKTEDITFCRHAVSYYVSKLFSPLSYGMLNSVFVYTSCGIKLKKQTKHLQLDLTYPFVAEMPKHDELEL